MSPRRVLFVTQSLDGGGAERAVVTLLRAIDHARHDVALALLRRSGALLADVPDDVGIHDLGEVSPYDWLRPTLRLRGLLRRDPPAVLVGVLRHPNLIALAAAVASRPRVPTVVVEQGLLSRGLEVGRGRALKRQLHRLLYPRAAALVAVSGGLVGDVESQVGPLHLPKIVIPNPCDVERVRALAEEEPDARLDWSRPTLVSIARLDPVKRLDLVLAAVARIGTGLPCQLVALGEGPERSALVRRAQGLGLGDRVHFLGFRANPYPYLKRARAFVLASDHEGFSNALVEAMACGAPVISTDCPFGPGEILAGGRFGLLVPPGDVGALAAAIERLLTDGDLATRLVLAGRARTDDFAATRVAALYQQLFERVSAPVT